MTHRTLAELVKVSRQTITNWFAAWEQGGIAALRNKSGQGRKPILRADDAAVIKAKVQRNLQQLTTVCSELRNELKRDFCEKHPQAIVTMHCRARWKRWRKSLKSIQDEAE